MQQEALTVPLVPRRRLVGLAFGTLPSARRGLGSDVAGSRPYRPGDDVDAIDWNASAKLSSARGADEFVVRERYADEAPRVVIVCDRRPAMSLFPPGLPWLSKSAAMGAAVELVSDSAIRARGLVGYLDYAEGEPFWQAPGSRRDALGPASFRAPKDTLGLAFEHLDYVRASLPAGTFVFVLSDFLVSPEPDAWLRVSGRRWDVVPVVIQDPTWEQSFPDVAGVAVPIVDAATGRPATLRLRGREALLRRERNERRLRALLDGFAELGLDPVVLSSAEPEDVHQAFVDWAALRRWFDRQEWKYRA